MLPKIHIGDSSSSNTIVLGCFHEEKSVSEDKKKTAEVPALVYLGGKSNEWDTLLGRLKNSKHFFAKKAETSLLRFYPWKQFTNVLLLGLGTQKKWNVEVCRQSGASLFHAQKKERLASVTLDGESVFKKMSPSDTEEFIQAFGEGYLMASYEYLELKEHKEPKFVVEGFAITGLKGEKTSRSVEKSIAIADSVNFARSLGDKPGNVLTPTEFARLVGKMAKETGLKCTVWGQKEIEKEKMGLFLGVSRGSAEEPKFIILEHRKGKKGDKPIVLVGKGITFDSGGISLKPAARMEDMKYDMMGAGAVAGISKAVAMLDLPINMVSIIAACENMPDGKAQKPGDVVVSRSGKTVEIINTDAEGRLILADALDYAQDLEPQAIIDFATLTGAVVDALGSVTSGIMGNHQGLIDRLKEAAEVTHERVWQLPLYEEYEEDLRSHYADIKNSGIREAGSSKGGTFLKFFVNQRFPWVHCDIAGSAYHRKDLNYHPNKNASGVMVRLITHLLADWKPLKN